MEQLAHRYGSGSGVPCIIARVAVGGGGWAVGGAGPRTHLFTNPRPTSLLVPLFLSRSWHCPWCPALASPSFLLPHSFLSSRYYLLIVLVLIIYLALLG